MSKRSSSRSSKTDRKRANTRRKEGVDLSDLPEATPEMLARAVLRYGLEKPKPKELITLRLDADVLKWFRARGKGYQTQINQLLRAYMELHRAK